MDRLTPELMLISVFQLIATGTETRELTFNLARRSGVVINSIHSEINELLAAPLQILDTIIQEVDLDPDNILVLEGGGVLADSLVMDTSRLLHHQINFLSEDRVIGTDAGVSHQTPMRSEMVMDFRMLPLEQRPISITNLRHNANTIQRGASPGLSVCTIQLRYIIVELSLEELGIINASRR